MVENNAFSEESLYEIARSKVNFRLSVKIHIGIFLVVSILLLTINLIFSPNILWVLYPFFGWFIGVVLHTTAYIVYARGVYPIAKRGVIFHTLAFIFTMLYLFIINVITFPSYYWTIYPLIFWGSALVIHNIAYLVYYRGKIDDQGETKSRRERAIEKEMEKMRKRIKK
ncbi:MAG: 2TM domain-containing protein [Candidatus Hodarchaeota archaeon]